MPQWTFLFRYWLEIMKSFFQWNWFQLHQTLVKNMLTYSFKRKKNPIYLSFFMWYVNKNVLRSLPISQNLKKKTLSKMNGLNKREYLVNLICINAQHSRAWYILTKGQLISKATNNQRKYFCISALASEMSQLKKIFGSWLYNFFE